MSQRTTVDEQSVEVIIETSRRMPVPTYSAILSQVAWSLDEIDRTARPGKNVRIQWGIAEVEGSSTIRAVLAPIALPSTLEPAALHTMTGGLVDGVSGLGLTPEIPKLFTASTVRRVEKVGAAVTRGHIEAVRIASVNGHRNESAVTATTSKNAHEAVTGTQLSLGSVQGILDVLDGRSHRGVRAQIYIPAIRRAVMVYAKAEHSASLKEYWGREVLASGELKRNSRGQVVSLDLQNVDEVIAHEYVSPWALLGADRGLTGHRTTAEYMEMIRGR